MKILLLNQTFFPDNLATSQQLADLASFLEKKGHQVSVIADRRGYEDRRKLFSKRENWNGIEIFRVSSTGFGKSRFRYRLLDSFTFLTALAVKLMRFEPQDLVISFTSPPLIGVFGMFFCWLKGGRTIQWLMDVNPDAAFQVGYLKSQSVLGRVLNWVFEQTLRGACSIVVLDRWMKNRVVSHGAQPEKVMVVPPWSVIKPREKNQQEQINDFRKKHGLEDKFVVLYSGNHSVVHPLDTVLETARELKDRKEVVFLFIGAGLRTKDVEKWKKDYSLENIIQLPLQPREKMSASFGSADLHCVVMGPGMSGLVHTSKVYSVLASGKPFVFVGPTKSHVADLLCLCPSGTVVAHEDVAGFIKAIENTRALSAAEKERIYHLSLDYLKNHDPSATLETFYEAVILEYDRNTMGSLAITNSSIID